MNNNQVILVNQKDQTIGVEEKLYAHQQGLLHRAFSIFVYCQIDGERKILLQQRQYNKYHSGGLWTNTCCSHPQPGETITEAGERRLFEELGFSVPLKKVGDFIYQADFDNGLIEHEFDHVLVGEMSASHLDQIQANPDEIAATKWCSVDEITTWYQQSPTSFTPWYWQAFEIFSGIPAEDEK